MPESLDLSIVIPCYNEQDRIAHTIKETIEAANLLNISYEILLVNDGSRDNTLNQIQGLASTYTQIKICSYEVNRGKGFAVKYGVNASKGDYYLIMDADLATDISELKRFRENRNKADCIIGNRKSDKVKMSFIRSLLGWITHQIIFLTLHLNVEDTQCGFKLLSAKTKHIWSSMYTERRGFDFELLYLLQQAKYKIIEMPVIWTAMDGSKVTIFSYITTIKDLYNVVMHHKLHCNKNTHNRTNP